MSDDLKNRGTADRTRINVHEGHEVRYWTKTLGVSEKTLLLAVNRVGPLVKDVERELKRGA
jgi:hypothetical protein